MNPFDISARSIWQINYRCIRLGCNFYAIQTLKLYNGSTPNHNLSQALTFAGLCLFQYYIEKCIVAS